MAEHLARQVVMVGLQPRGDGGRQVGGVANRFLRRRARAHREHVVGAELEARDVHAPAVHEEVAVADELAGLRARRREAQPVDDVVEPQLEEAEQDLTGDAGAPRRLLVVVAELLLEHAVVPLRLLLLAQLREVLGLLDPAAAVLAGRVRAALDAAFLGQAALALQEELHALSAALLALGACGTGHRFLSAGVLRRAGACAAGTRCVPGGRRPSRTPPRDPPPARTGSPSRDPSPGP